MPNMQMSSDAHVKHDDNREMIQQPGRHLVAPDTKDPEIPPFGSAVSDSDMPELPQGDLRVELAKDDTFEIQDEMSLEASDGEAVHGQQDNSQAHNSPFRIVSAFVASVCRWVFEKLWQ
jgi:hypothetical protein